MSIVDSQIRTVTCNGVDCKNTVTFDVKEIQQTSDATPWFKTLRVVQTAQGRNFAYCSDPCELSAVGAGVHNPEEPKKVIGAPGGANAIAQAAAAAKAQEDANKNIKEGRPVTLHGA